MLSEVRSTVRYRNWNARWNGGGTACSFGGLGHDVARPDGGDAGLGEAAGVVGDGVDELAGAQAVGEGVAGAQPHHEAAAGELRHLHHEQDVERLHARRGVREQVVLVDGERPMLEAADVLQAALGDGLDEPRALAGALHARVAGPLVSVHEPPGERVVIHQRLAQRARTTRAGDDSGCSSSVPPSVPPS